MATKKTWIWVLAAIFGLCVVCMAAIAGLGIYFVASNVSSNRTTGAQAIRSFEEVRGRFKDTEPLLEMDRRGEPRPTRRLSELPSSERKPQHLWILAWDPDKERMSKISLPFWMLKLGRNDFRVQQHRGVDANFDLETLDLDFDQLERVGPLLIFDFRTSDGRRVLVWTE